MSEAIADIELTEIKGVGPRTEEKLRSAGVDSLLDLAASLPSELEDALGGREKASSLILSAKVFLEEKGILEEEFTPASDIMERRARMKKLTTGSTELDQLLKGGVETQAVTEFFGEYGSGKSQLCHTLAATCQLPEEEGGLGKPAIYVDTESTFRPERVAEIAEGTGMDQQEVLENVIVCGVYNSKHLELVTQDLGKYVQEYEAGLIIVDSLIGHHRAEYVGRGQLADRQQSLNEIVHRLVRVAQIYNVAVVVTNQVLSQPDTFFGDPTKATGGHVVAHNTTYRIYLRKSKDERVARMVDSPYHPYSEAKFKITDRGIEDT